MTWEQDNEYMRKVDRIQRIWKFMHFAKSLLDAHGLTDWITSDCFRFRLAEPNCLGFCNRDARVIWLDSYTAAEWSLAKQRDLVLHEIAHALADADGELHGHDEVWAATALRIGVRRGQLILDLEAASSDRCDKRAAAARLALTGIISCGQRTRRKGVPRERKVRRIPSTSRTASYSKR